MRTVKGILGRGTYNDGPGCQGERAQLPDHDGGDDFEACWRRGDGDKKTVEEV